jgi:hypothetical protein
VGSYRFEAGVLWIDGDDGRVVARFPAFEPPDDVEQRAWPSSLASVGHHWPLIGYRYRVLLENGLTVSVVWGPATYSDNYHALVLSGDPLVETPYSAELACWWPDGDLVAWADGDSVQEYVPADLFPVVVGQLAVLATGTVPLSVVVAEGVDEQVGE